RAVELHAAVARRSSHLDSRIILVRGDLQVGEGLAVLQVLVELRLDVLDQTRFGEHRVDFALAFQIVRVADLVDPRTGSGLELGRPTEVASGSRAQMLRLADIDDSAGRILEQIDAGAVRKLPDSRRSAPEAEQMGHGRPARRVARGER